MIYSRVSRDRAQRLEAPYLRYFGFSALISGAWIAGPDPRALLPSSTIISSWPHLPSAGKLPINANKSSS